MEFVAWWSSPIQSSNSQFVVSGGCRSHNFSNVYAF